MLTPSPTTSTPPTPLAPAAPTPPGPKVYATASTISGSGIYPRDETPAFLGEQKREEVVPWLVEL
jgi:hypothetical protein